MGKNVLIVMVPILINKDVCEPSYDDLKFTVRNRSYFCTNRTKSDTTKMRMLVDLKCLSLHVRSWLEYQRMEEPVEFSRTAQQTRRHFLQRRK